MKKNLIYLILVFILAVFIVSCGEKTSQQAAKQPATEVREETLKTIETTSEVVEMKEKVATEAVEHDVDVVEKEVVAKDEIEPVKKPKTEKRGKSKPIEKAEKEPEKKVNPATEGGNSEIRTEPAVAKPAEPAVKPMTAEERKKLEEEMNKTKKELDERRKAEDPSGTSSNVTDEDKEEIDRAEQKFSEENGL